MTKKSVYFVYADGLVVTAQIQSSLRGPPGNAPDFEAEMAVSLSCGVILYAPNQSSHPGLHRPRDHLLGLLGVTRRLFFLAAHRPSYISHFAHHPSHSSVSHMPCPPPSYAHSSIPSDPAWCLAHSRHLISISGMMKSVTSSTSAQWDVQPWRASWRSCQLGG